MYWVHGYIQYNVISMTMTTQVDTTIATMEMYKPVVFLDCMV